MMTLDGLIVFLLGLVLGSFYNVVGIRLPQNISFAKGRSKCQKCDRNLHFYELFPVFSYLFLKGKCKKCKTSISMVYPLFELFCGIFFFIGYVHFGYSLHFIFFCLLVSFFSILCVSDLFFQIVPDRILLFFLPFFLILFFFIHTNSFIYHVVSFLFCLLFMYVLIFFTNGKGMGGGDVKIFLILSFLLGFKSFIFLFFLSAYIGLFHGLAYRLIKKEKIFPFVPSIALSTLLIILYGDTFNDWILSFHVFFFGGILK